MNSLDRATRENLFDMLLRLGDERLILGHRLSEWCGHGPILEEDIALTNLSLDCLGQANMFLSLAAQLEAQGRDADRLAFFRDTGDFRNILLVELPNQDFAHTMVRQFLFDHYAALMMEGLQESAWDELAGVAAKSLKETRYHCRHSSQWVLRLGDGTTESHTRAQSALDRLWRYTSEFFFEDELESRLVSSSLIPARPALQSLWNRSVVPLLQRATLSVPEEAPFPVGEGRLGRHTEHLGLLLAEMQVTARAQPEATW